MRKQTKNQTKTPAAAKRTAKQTPAATVARAIIQAVDEAETRAVLAGGPQPFALAPVPADFAAAVRPLLFAARLPAGALDPQVGRFAALVEEWDRVFDKTPLPCDPAAAWRELGRRELRRDWNAYRRAELARISARLAAKALRELRRLSPEAARAAAEEARPRFADAGAAVLEYLAAPLPGVDADEDTASPRVFVALLDDALDALAECARNPPLVAGEPATPTAAAVRELGAKVEAAAAATREAVRAVGAPVSALVEERRNADADDAAVRETQKREAFEAWAHGFDFATPGGASARRASFVMFCGGKEGAAYRGVPRMLNAEEFERLCQNKMRNLRR